MNKEITVNSEKVFEGKIINVRIDTVEVPNKKYAKREIVEHKGAVGIVAMDNDELILVKQYRKAVEDFLYEIPAGKLELNEEPLAAANRELIEETGFCPNKLEKLTEFYTSPGFSNEKIYLYKATELKEVGSNPDEDEFIEIVRIKFDEALNLVKQNKIKDAKTIIAILYVLNV
ncbi:NUDIX hydrolase [Sedimentibacter sp. zth1]|uniref:NUDIX hydrolase n=1 Tax=Sedimentibacter sp. zth1 TaxID=2816908 RepID=UPI001A90EC97|nr:NUDIX hydrolase [Sedimentibacter sp. zth1]QSX06809.1 NUDIX hydrolase [Sedimentibacter sp. zth1]